MGLLEFLFVVLLWIAAFVSVYELFKRGVYPGVKMALREESDWLVDRLAEALHQRTPGRGEASETTREPEGV